MGGGVTELTNCRVTLLWVGGRRSDCSQKSAAHQLQTLPLLRNKVTLSRTPKSQSPHIPIQGTSRLEKWESIFQPGKSLGILYKVLEKSGNFRQFLFLIELYLLKWIFRSTFLVLK